MPDTRRQTAKARRSKEMDMLLDFENMDRLHEIESVNSIERELAYVIKSSLSNNDAEAFPKQRGNFSQENEIRYFGGENTISGNIGYLSLWKDSQMGLICVCRKKWTR